MDEHRPTRPGLGPQGQDRAEQTASILTMERVFPLALRFDLDGPSLRYVPSRPKPFGETKKLFPCPVILTWLEAPGLLHLVVSSPTAHLVFVLGAREDRQAGREAAYLSRGSLVDYSAIEIQNPLAANLILAVSSGMGKADSAVSKLCADKPRHIQVRRLSAACLHSTWQEEGQTLPVASSPVCRKRHVETVPVSTPFGLRAAVVSRPWTVRP